MGDTDRIAIGSRSIVDITAAATAAPTVMVCLLGGFRIVRSGAVRPVLPESKAGLFLRRLALAGPPGVPREEMLGMLWPDADDAAGGRCFNTLVTEVRKLLRDADDDVQPLLNGDGCYRLNACSGVGTDVQQFDLLVDRGHQAVAAGAAAEALACYQQALELYRGDLYVGRGPWSEVDAFVEQERLRSRCLTVLGRSAELAIGVGDVRAAIAHARRLLSMDACSERGHRLVMHTYMLRGERAQCLRQYRVCAEAMRREFDTEPEPATAALYDLARCGTWSAEAGLGLIRS